MDRVVPTLLFVLVVAVVGVGGVIWRADQRAHRDSQELICIQRAQSSATIALLAPAARIDADGRVAAMKSLARRTDRCGQ